MGRIQASLSAVVCLVGLLPCLLVGESVSAPVFVRRTSESDAGPVDSCVQLPPSSECGLDYPVPESLATISAAIEQEIKELSEDRALYRSEECMQTARDIMCAQRFPRCEMGEEGEVRVLLTSLNCEQRVTESCEEQVATVLLRDFCDLQNSTQEAATCKSIAEHENEAAAGSGLQYCAQDLQRRVTPWMYELMRYYDTRFAKIAGELRDGFSETCFQRQANFTCQLLGQCSEDGRRVEILNTFEACESFINCFPEAHAEALRESYDCSHWPHLVTTSPPDTPSTSPSKMWPTTPAPKTVMGENSSHTLHRLSLAALTAAFTLHFLL